MFKLFYVLDFGLDVSLHWWRYKEGPIVMTYHEHDKTYIWTDEHKYL